MVLVVVGFFCGLDVDFFGVRVVYGASVVVRRVRRRFCGG